MMQEEPMLLPNLVHETSTKLRNILAKSREALVESSYSWALDDLEVEEALLGKMTDLKRNPNPSSNDKNAEVPRSLATLTLPSSSSSTSSISSTAVNPKVSSPSLLSSSSSSSTSSSSSLPNEESPDSSNPTSESTITSTKAEASITALKLDDDGSSTSDGYQGESEPRSLEQVVEEWNILLKDLGGESSQSFIQNLLRVFGGAGGCSVSGIGNIGVIGGAGGGDI